MPKFLFYPYYGPNRRSDRRVVEIRIEFSAAEVRSPPDPLPALRHALQDHAVLGKGEVFAGQLAAADPLTRYAGLLAAAAVQLQRSSGHRVEYTHAFQESGSHRRVALVEHEDSRAGMAAVKWLIDLLTRQGEEEPGSYARFSAFARSRALCAETAAIIEELNRRQIGYFQLDREPLEGNMQTGPTIRPNGRLIVGHGQHHEVLDGTFCVSRLGVGLRPLLNQPEQRRAILAQSGLPLADPAKQQAAGNHYRLLLINGKARLIGQGKILRIEAPGLLHPDTLDAALKLSQRIGLAPLSLSLLSEDPSRPLATNGGGVTDFDLAPRLDDLLPSEHKGSSALQSAVADLLDWLAPEPSRLRLPIAAVTGTNGKTSTSRMIAHILGTAGYRPGLVCTDGTFVNGKKIQQGDASAFIGHARVLTNKSIDAAVLESHHRGIAVRGFVFEQCDVAVCLNVTADHLAEGQIETLEEMVAVKRALVERGRAVVLNADNPGCISMIPHLSKKRLCLYSSSRSAKELEGIGATRLLCTTEVISGTEWVLIHDAGKVLQVLPVSEIPCSYKGAARFLLENALAAMCAAYLVGVPLAQFASAMKSFEMNFENAPGRLSVYRDLPFTAVVDYAHNPDGIARLAEFTDSFPVTGRRLMLIAGTGSRTDDTIAKCAQAAAGHFDHYVCRSYPNLRGRQPDEVPAIVHSALLDAGVPESSISHYADALQARQAILDMAAEDDLVVLQLSSKEFKPVHQQLTALRARQESV